MYLVRFFILSIITLVSTHVSAQTIERGQSGLNGFTDFAVPGWNTELGFVAEGRIGNSVSGPVTEHEIGFGPTTGGGEDRGNFSWPNGSYLPFSLVYNGLNTGSTFSIGQVQTSFSFTGYGDDFNALAIRSSAFDQQSVMFQDLRFNGQLLDDGTASIAHSGSGRSVGWLLVSGLGSLEDTPFQLTGQAKLAWNAPNNAKQSRLAFQIKGANAPRSVPVPEPSTYLMLAGCLTAVLWLRARKQTSMS